MKGVICRCMFLDTDIYLSANRVLSYLQGLNVHQRRLELARRIHFISERMGITHTRAFRWGTELGRDDPQGQAQATVREVDFFLIYLLIFKLIGPINGYQSAALSSPDPLDAIARGPAASGSRVKSGRGQVEEIAKGPVSDLGGVRRRRRLQEAQWQVGPVSDLGRIRKRRWW